MHYLTVRSWTAQSPKTVLSFIWMLLWKKKSLSLKQRVHTDPRLNLSNLSCILYFLFYFEVDISSFLLLGFLPVWLFPIVVLLFQLSVSIFLGLFILLLSFFLLKCSSDIPSFTVERKVLFVYFFEIVWTSCLLRSYVWPCSWVHFSSVIWCCCIAEFYVFNYFIHRIVDSHMLYNVINCNNH